MSGRSYLQHGRRHAKKGSDPTPDQGDSNVWALYGGNGDTNVVVDDRTYMGVDWWAWGPTDQDVFSLGTGVDALAGLDALQVNTPGVYKVSPFVSVEGTLGDEFTVGFDGSTANWTATNTQAQRFNSVTLGANDPAEPAHLVTYSQLVFLGGSLSAAQSAPWSTLPYVKTFLGNSAFTLDIFEVLVERMSDDYGTTLTGGQFP